jgi:hypothetical protein
MNHETTTIEPSFEIPPHEPGDTVTLHVLPDGSRESYIAAAVACLAQLPDYVTGAWFEFRGETIHLDGALARSSNQHRH